MQPGTIIAGKFRVERTLGEGGMGIVVVATHLQLDQTVALKFLHQDIVWQAEIMERLLREARASARLKSEHACRVMDVGQLPGGAPYIVMELLDGQDLAARVRSAPLAPAIAAEYVLQACVAIAEAHAAGIVHRDLKPSNLFVTERLDGSPLIKVLDFGIAKSAAKADVQITRTAAVMGSPGYMSPEQLRSSKSVDARTDIWALGVILYEAVSGRLPFVADSITELAVKVAMDEPEPLATDPAYQAIVMRCLQKSPDKRFQSVAELAVELARVAGPRGATSAGMIARLAAGKATAPRLPAASTPVAEPLPPTQPAHDAPPGWAVPSPPGWAIPAPPVWVAPDPALPAPIGPSAAATEPPPPGAATAVATRPPSARAVKRPWRIVVVGALAGLGALIAGAVLLARHDDGPAAVAPVTPTSGSGSAQTPAVAATGSGSAQTPAMAAKGEGDGSAGYSQADLNEALGFLDKAYTQNNGNKPGTRDEALAFLDRIYAQQLEKAQTANEPDPDTVFAIDITAALAAGQVEGAKDAPVTIVDASDFGCPYCRTLSTTLDELLHDYHGKLRIVYMNMIVHPQLVTVAHQYSCAAAKQGAYGVFMRAFWAKGFDAYAASHDASLLGEDNILTFTSSLGLDVTKLKADAHSAACTQRVAADMAELAKFKVNSTPTYYINGKVVAGALRKEEIAKRIDEQLRIASASGIPAAQYYEQVILARGEKQFRSKAAAQPAARKPPTREDALAFLVKVYKQQRAAQQAQEEQEADPEAVFAVDVKAAVEAYQIDGPDGAAVTIVEAFDLACPYCSQMAPVIDELVDDYSGKLRVVYMNMIVHPQVQTAHEYGCAAAKQGKFHAFRRAFYDQAYAAYAASQNKDAAALGEARILKIARGLGLDRARLKADAASAACKRRIEADQAELARFHVNATPTFYVNGKFISGAHDKAYFQKIINERLDAVHRSGISAAAYYETEVMAKGLPQFRSKKDARKP